MTPSQSLSHSSRMWSRTVWMRAAANGSMASLSLMWPKKLDPKSGCGVKPVKDDEALTTPAR